MAHRRRAYEKVHVARKIPQCPQPGSLLTERSARLVIQMDDFYRLQKQTQCLLVAVRIPRVNEALMEFGE